MFQQVRFLLHLLPYNLVGVLIIQRITQIAVSNMETAGTHVATTDAAMNQLNRRDPK